MSVLCSCGLDNGNFGSIASAGQDPHVLTGWGQGVVGLWEPSGDPTLIDDNAVDVVTGMSAVLNGNDQGGVVWYRADNTLWCRWVTPYCAQGVSTGAPFAPSDDTPSMLLGQQMMWSVTENLFTIPGDLMEVVGSRWGGCVILNGITPGEIWCWGYDRFGAMGINSGPYTPTAHKRLITKTPLAVLGGWRSMVVTNDGAHACGISNAGDLYCWGSNFGGVVDPNADDRNCMGASTGLYPDPVPILSGTMFDEVSVYGGTACAVSDDGDVWCWGTQPVGMFNIPDPTVSGVPGSFNACGSLQEFPTGFHEVTWWTNLFTQGAVDDVSLGEHSGCLRRTESSRVYCWGSNDQGMLGQCNECADVPGLNGLATHSPFLFKVELPIVDDPDWQVAMLPPRMAQHACVEGFNTVTGDAAVWCWGWNFLNQLGRSVTPIAGCVSTLGPYNDNSCPQSPGT